MRVFQAVLGIPVVLLLLAGAQAEQVAFNIVPAQSSLKLTDTAYLSTELIIPLPPQFTDADQVSYSGTIIGDLNGNVLTFAGGSRIIAGDHPQSDEMLPYEGGPGGPEDPAAQDLNYAFGLPGYPISEVDTTTLYVQIFDTVLDIPGGSITSGQPAVDFDVELDEGGYGLALEFPDIVNDTGWFNKPFDVFEPDPTGPNVSIEVASLVTVGNQQILTIPIDTTIIFTIDACCGNTPPTEFRFEGTLVATRSLGGIPEDLNGDGGVDAADAGIMFGNWGGTGAGDLNADNIIDAADAGQMFAAWTGDAGPVSVPEPTSGMLCALALAAVLRARRRR